MGRAARNARGRVILYADRVTDSIKAATHETQRRREAQAEYNRLHGITPRSVVRSIMDLQPGQSPDFLDAGKLAEKVSSLEIQDKDDLVATIRRLREEMREAAGALEFERAAELRDRARELEELALELG
jgi:excinuclease ABC subunit B